METFLILLRDLGFTDAFGRYTPLNEEELDELILISSMVECWKKGCREGIRYPWNAHLGRSVDMHSTASEIRERSEALLNSLRARHGKTF